MHQLVVRGRTSRTGLEEALDFSESESAMSSRRAYGVDSSVSLPSAQRGH
nr:MAG TPA: hypothetical protein [Caudoviricetes sp.]